MKIVTGQVVSVKMNHTAVVEDSRFVFHPLYHKRLRRTRRIHADCPEKLQVGDLVQLVETRPTSRTKHWRVTRVVKPYGPA